MFKIKIKMRIKECLSVLVLCFLALSVTAETESFTFGEAILWLIDVLGFTFIDSISGMFDYIFLIFILIITAFIFRNVIWKKKR